jgi:hypothetical protein
MTRPDGDPALHTMTFGDVFEIVSAMDDQLQMESSTSGFVDGNPMLEADVLVRRARKLIFLSDNLRLYGADGGFATEIHKRANLAREVVPDPAEDKLTVVFGGVRHSMPQLYSGEVLFDIFHPTHFSMGLDSPNPNARGSLYTLLRDRYSDELGARIFPEVRYEEPPTERKVPVDTGSGIGFVDARRVWRPRRRPQRPT